MSKEWKLDRGKCENCDSERAVYLPVSCPGKQLMLLVLLCPDCDSIQADGEIEPFLQQIGVL